MAYFGIVLVSGLGAGSLILLAVFLFVGSFHFFPLGLGREAALAWDAMLSLAFFLQHSGMVRRDFRRRLAKFVAEPYHGLVYTGASGVCLILCMLLWQRTGSPIVVFDGVSGWGLRALFVLAIAGLAWGVLALGSFDILGVKPAIAHRRGSRSPQDPFVVKGPYRWVRHPLYFVILVLVWSCPVVTADRLLFNLLWTAWVVLGTVLEERDLVVQFGERYVRYRRRVPMILPWRSPFRGSFD